MILEKLKNTFFKDGEKITNPSSEPLKQNVEVDLDSQIPSIGFFNTQEDEGFFGNQNKNDTIQKQNKLISLFRNISNMPEVFSAINIIVDEAVFSLDKNPFEIVFDDNEINKNIIKKISNELKEVQNLLKIESNLFNIFKTFYIDGQINLLTIYDEKNIKSGIKKILVLSPFNFTFNQKKNIWEYIDEQTMTDFSNISSEKKQFAKEEIVHANSGIYSENLILSNLYFAIKPANMLQTLEDMLIPMRYSRSVSRRVFNIDVSKLNAKKAEEVMKKYEARFRYRNFYDPETGTIKNQQHIKALTEDYWFPNRDGSKGTQVDLLDETGNLGELGDILYFKRKLYTALQIPINRITDNGESDADYDFTATQIKYEELKFFNFITRLRNQFVEIIYELLKRNLIAKGIIKETEWNEIRKIIKIKFKNENTFFENLKREKLQDNLNLLNSVEDYIGKFFSVEYIFKKVLTLNDEEIEVMKEQILNEKKDEFYKKFYEDED